MRSALLLAPASALLLGCAEADAGVATETLEYLSKTYAVNGIHRSMMGPRSREYIALTEGDPELLWVTGFEAVMVGGDGVTPEPQEFMCHSNFSLQDPYQRLFTLSQGQLSIQLPPGFGFPVMSDELFSVETQVLNLNEPGLRDHPVRHKIRVHYVRDRELAEPISPLAVTYGISLVSLEEKAIAWNLPDPNELQKEACCLPGTPASLDSLMKDDLGREFSGHYEVPPGRHEFSTLVTDQMALEWDTRIHYVAVHLHPFAESCALRDLTTGETVWEARTRQFEDRIGLEHVDDYSSTEGLPVYADHEYELVAVYDNTSGRTQDSMAVMIFYVADPTFDEEAFRAKHALERERTRALASPDVEPGKIALEHQVAGDGPSPVDGDMVVVHYIAYLEGGTKVQDTRERGKPLAFAIGRQRVMPGLELALREMRVGGKSRVTIPPDLGLGPRESGDGLIPANSTLVLDVELVEIPDLPVAVLADGSGEGARPGQIVSVHYRGWLADGTEFDSSYRRGEPFTFPLGRGRVIPAWDRALEGRKVGERIRLHAPASLAYGPLGFGDQVPPDADLDFEIEVVGIR